MVDLCGLCYGWVLVGFMRDQAGQLGESGEYRMGRSESGPHYIQSSDGGSPGLCRLRTASVVPPNDQEQVIIQVDEGLVLLQGTLACLPIGREIDPCSSLTHEHSKVSHETLY
jgi:hypothetical protein